MGIKIKRNAAAIQAKIAAGEKKMISAVTEAVIQYGNIFVREDQGNLKNSALTKSLPKEGLAIWDPGGNYAKRVYYTGTPSKDVNANASLMWAEKGVNTYKKELDQIAQNNFAEGMEAK